MTPDSFPANIRFKFPWRQYQQRVLDELSHHLDDNHLHVIAPPGSGKTVLGLEVMLRLNKPALILAPTIAIRDQWIDRFLELFLQQEQLPDWISRDIRKPAFLTVSTYQGLHAAMTHAAPGLESDEEEPADNHENEEISECAGSREIIEALEKQRLGTIVADEAHHMKNAWWRSLNDVKQALNPTVVGLTATPPYDVTPIEWQRYTDLCGPVDAEISVPELVVEGDLCPHQDYVYFSFPCETELSRILSYRNRQKELYQDLLGDEVLAGALEGHPAFQNPEAEVDWIYTHSDFYSAMLIFLHQSGREILKEHFKVVGGKRGRVPAMDTAWLQTVLSFYLFGHNEIFEPYEEHQEGLKSRLKRAGVLENRSIRWGQSEEIHRYLNSSISKLESIRAIVNYEYSQLEQDLRMVVLTDYIRREYLFQGDINLLPLEKIGVMSIFECLRRQNSVGMKLGVLTGTLVIIPVSAVPAFKRMCGYDESDQFRLKPLCYDEEFVQAEANQHHVLVSIVTRLFQSGDIEVLIGTKSLLGEGWDAPTMNALILASFVGSYVLSNQMRGRAIRTERNNPRKTGNIWHLVCVDPNNAEGGPDLETLRRRFKTFVGVSMHEPPTLQNRIGRLDLPANLNTDEQLRQVNRSMFEQAGMREGLKSKWEAALAGGSSLIEEVKVPHMGKRSFREVKTLHYQKTLGYAMALMGTTVLSFGQISVRVIFGSVRYFGADVVQVMAVLGLIGTGLLLPKAAATFRMLLKFRDISKDIESMGRALMMALQEAEFIQTPLKQLHVVAGSDITGAVYCRMEGGTSFERSIFIRSLREMLQPLLNPRYIIVRKSYLFSQFSQRDYHAVPEILGRNRQTAIIFRKHWRDHVGRCNLIYTRQGLGRKILIKAKMESLSSQLLKKTERINVWR